MNRTYAPARRRKRKKEQKMSPLLQYWRRLDKPLILATVLLSVLSILLLYSLWICNVSSAVSASQYRTQLFSTLIGIVCVLVLAAVDYHKIVRLWFLYAPVALILTLLCFTPLGHRRAGADDQAWLNLGFIQFQPSELLKLVFILTFALHLAKDEKNMNRPLHMLLLCIHGAIPTGLIALQGGLWHSDCFCCDLSGDALFCAHFMEIYLRIHGRNPGGADRRVELCPRQHT